jgi:hypothetical protein
MLRLLSWGVVVSSLAATALSQQTNASPAPADANTEGSSKKKRRLSFSAGYVSSQPAEDGAGDENYFPVPAVPSAVPVNKRARANAVKVDTVKPTTPINTAASETSRSSSGKKKANNLLEKFDATVLPPPAPLPESVSSVPLTTAPVTAPAANPAGGRRVMGLAPGAVAARRAASAGNRGNNDAVMDSLLMLG